MIIPAFAVIPTHDRMHMLIDAVHSIMDQVDFVIIINNNKEEALHLAGPNLRTLDVPTETPNIQDFWNIGLQLAQSMAYSRNSPEYDVVVLNDDIRCPPDFVEALSAEMRKTSAVLAYPDQFYERTELHTVPEPIDLTARITGYAYMLRGESGIRLDEEFVWWYGDDDLDWRARESGGALMVAGCAVEHRAPNVQTNARPELLAQTAVDRQHFIDKWGMAPH
jgi:hypothetical protein